MCVRYTITQDMACVRVSKLVNNAKHDSPDCLQPGL